MIKKKERKEKSLIKKWMTIEGKKKKFKCLKRSREVTLKKLNLFLVIRKKIFFPPFFIPFF